jgi:hypothetical protein
MTGDTAEPLACVDVLVEHLGRLGEPLVIEFTVTEAAVVRLLLRRSGQHP